MSFETVISIPLPIVMIMLSVFISYYVVKDSDEVVV